MLGLLLCLSMITAMPAVYAALDTDSYFVQEEYTQRISMDFKGASLIDVLKAFSKQSGKNFIAAGDIADKKVTLYLDKIPFEDALHKILDANDLMYEAKPDSDIFIVKAKPTGADNLITRVFPLNNATVPSSKLNSTITLTSSSGSSGSSSSSTAGLLSAVKAVLSSDGTVVEDPRTNSLIVRDTKEQMIFIEEAIAKLDVPVPEILIELEMLDISKTTSDLMGVKFGEAPFSLKGASKETYFPFNQADLLGKLEHDGAGVPAYTAGTISAAGLTAVVNFLKTQSDTRNLAKPRILTLNNQTAEIKISTNEAIGVSSSTDTTASTGTSTEQAERVQTGVFLSVTPQASIETGEILLAVSPKVIQARTGITVKDVTYKDPEERGTQSILKVKDGETIVLGGLIRDDDSNTITKVPVLGDLPLVGGAFRHKNKQKSQRELIIFITPHIVTDGNIKALKLGQPNNGGIVTADSMNRMELMKKSLNMVESNKR